MHDAVRVYVESHFDLRNAAGGGSDTRQHEIAESLVVLAEFPLALQNVNVHARLIVRRRGEHLALFDGDRGISVDDSRKHAAEGFDAQRKRGDVEKENVLDFARQNAALHRRADRHALVGVDALERFLARHFAHFFDHRGHTGGAAHKDDFVDVFVGKSRVFHGKPHRLHGPVQKIRGHRLEFLFGQIDVEMLRSLCAHGDEGQIDIGGIHARKLYLGFFGSFLQSLHRHLVLRQVDGVGFLELVYEIFDDLVVPVVAAQPRVAVRGEHFENAVGNFKDGNVERTAAEVVDHDFAALVFIEPVSERRRRRLVDDSQNVESRDLARVLGRLTLTVGKVSGAGDDRLRHFRSEICLRVRFELSENHCGNFLRGIRFIVDFYFIVGSHMPFNGDNGLVGVCDSLTFCRLSDDAGAVLLERYYGRGSSGSFRIGDNDGLAAFHHCHARICRT